MAEQVVFVMTAGPHYEGATTTRIFTSKERAIEEGLKSEVLDAPQWRPHHQLPDYWETDMSWMRVSPVKVEE